MFEGLEEVELGIIVRIGVLVEVMNKTSLGGIRWWLACDPRRAPEMGYVVVGYGYPDCDEEANASFFIAPVLNDSVPRSGIDDLVVAWDSNLVTRQYGENDSGVYQAFFTPIKRALVERLWSELGETGRFRTEPRLKGLPS